MVPLLSVPLSFVIDYGHAIALVNMGFIVLGTIMTYFLVTRLFHQEVGSVAAISFASAIPVLAYGVAVLTDGAGYAMLVTVVCGTVPYAKEEGFQKGGTHWPSIWCSNID